MFSFASNKLSEMHASYGTQGTDAKVSKIEQFPPQILKKLLIETQSLVDNPLEGIKCHVNDTDITDIQAVIDGPADTPYFGGLFKVKLILGKEFPHEPPKAYFLTKIFHPNVATNGEICVNTLKKDWNSNLGIKHILLTIKCLLIVPNAESALNEEAGKLLLEDYNDYSRRAKLMTEIHAQVYTQSQDKKLSAEKKKYLKEKKKSLKRL